jgi:hypothetical protein
VEDLSILVGSPAFLLVSGVDVEKSIFLIDDAVNFVIMSFKTTSLGVMFHNRKLWRDLDTISFLQRKHEDWWRLQ